MAQPDLILKPFGAEATAGTINVIPDERPSGAAPQLASWSLGFPLITMTYPGAGGLPPFGQDMNGVLNAISQHTVFLGGGGQYKWSSAYVMAFGGYSLGSIVQANDGLNSYVSLINNNSDDFNSSPGVIGTSWALYSGRALQQSQATETVMGIARIATNVLAVAGSDDTTIMTPLKVKGVLPTQATETNLGLLRIATLPQVQEGSVIDRAVTPSTLKAVLPTQATETILGLLRIATLPQVQEGVSISTAVTPSTIKALFPKRSFTENDFIRIPDVPGGLIIQFGTANLVADGNITLTMPVPFPSFGLAAFVTLNNITFNTGSDAGVGVVIASRSTLTIRSGVASPSPAFWVAFGY